MGFNSELEFENELIKMLMDHGWKELLKNPSEEDLINNWAKIIFNNNRSIDRLNDCELTEGEMRQILNKVTELRTPLKLNEFINGGEVSIIRDHPDDKTGREVYLKIFDKDEISAGQTVYQIAEQPRFNKRSKLLNDRRGDLMFLINGIPVFHIELKSSKVSLSEAYDQIKKYSHEGVFTGIFSLVQIFVAMTPEEAVYFANPGPDGIFNPDYNFHWANFDNEPINDWKTVATTLLSLPMAHQMIGYYSVADSADGILKVMRSYQYFAVNAIVDKVAKNKWNEGNQLGGYVWHTTGSGKTMTSFKAAQLIANSRDADKVIFLTDRIELGTQSLKEYRAFADELDSVQATENTYVLVSKLKSSNRSDTLIVTSIQKMHNIKDEDGGLNEDDLNKIRDKRIVFIIDEAHRSVFGDMLVGIKNSFPNALFFGFTGTPILDVNKKHGCDNTTIFGDELHRYSISDGIRDKNVLGFDVYKILTFKDIDLRKAVALEKAKSKVIDEVAENPEKRSIYDKYITRIPMAGFYKEDGTYSNGIEDEVPKAQYTTDEHRNKVVEDIKQYWEVISAGNNHKFHGIFATSSIPEAIEYYRLLKKEIPEMKTTCLFDPTIDNEETPYGREDKFKIKEDGLIEILEDYNERYEQNFTMQTHSLFKKDVALRMAHKEIYKWIDKEPHKQLDLMIVVNQMLTGFDSKWVNTLFLDKELEYTGIIQAFSRTNRLFASNEKPFGIIRYYRRPHTMERKINEAVAAYSGNRPLGLFVDKMDINLKGAIEKFNEISELYENAGILDFSSLPADKREIAKFASLFNKFHEFILRSEIQGFKWEKNTYIFDKGSDKEPVEIELNFTKKLYYTLLQRYQEIKKEGPVFVESIPYDIKGYLTEIKTGMIDSEYMNSRFEKWMKLKDNKDINQESVVKAKEELHKTFASLSQEEQKYANQFLHDIESGNVIAEEGKTFVQYITDYQNRAKNDQIHKFAYELGIDENKLRKIMKQKINEKNINEFGRFDELKSTLDKAKAKEYFENQENIKIPMPLINMRVDKLLRKFIIEGGFEI